ncbi:MAG: hypothetical protein RLZZ444_635, partial [Pseudomonadota bacterium]
ITEQSRWAIAAFRKNHGIAEREMTV